jgi:L-cysteate sulfo-lyase
MTPYPSRLDFCQHNTPLEPLRRLHRSIGGPALFVKRDDCTGLAMGGNKARKLEYLLADAVAQNANVIVTSGAIQSNHVRQTAAAAARLGLECHVVLERRVPSSDSAYYNSGNILLDRLFGASVHLADAEADIGHVIKSVVGGLADEGRSAYLVPSGGSNDLGALGYVECASELLEQQSEQGCQFDHIVHPTSSGGTQAGLIVGLRKRGSDARVIGVSVRQDRAAQEALVGGLVAKVARRLGLESNLTGCAVVDDRHIGPGYGVADAATWDAVRRLAEYEGLLLDPVYTGKAMACLLSLIRSDQFSSRSAVVFLHTGGTPAIFAYGDELNEAIAAAKGRSEPLGIPGQSD